METVHESGPGGTSITVRKSAFCEQHTPLDSDAKPRLDDVAALGIVTSKNKKSPKKSMEDHPLPILFRGLMNFRQHFKKNKLQSIQGRGGGVTEWTKAPKNIFFSYLAKP